MGDKSDQQLYSLHAEQSVLGGVMIDEHAYDRVSLSEADFGRQAHRSIWRAIVSLREDGEPIDVVTISDRLEAWGEDAGGLGYVGQIASDTPSAANIAGYARVVREHATRRSLISTASSIAEAARDRQRDVTDVVDSAQRDVLALSSTGQESRLTPMSSHISAFLEDTEWRVENGDGLVGVPTGQQDVDNLIHGFEGGDLIVLAGRPGMGKTMEGMQWCENIASHTGKPAPFFSIEMPAIQLLRRSAARNARIPLERLRSGNLEDGDWGKLSHALQKIQQSPLYVDDTGGLTFAELRSRARRLHQQSALSALFVDYVQIINPGDLAPHNARDDQKIGEVSKNLKSLAKELDIPVIALAQLNRSVEQRSDKRPNMSDLREAGQIEQDADVIAFLYRDEVYDSESPMKGVAELLVRKQRNGPPGTVYLTFLGQYQAFEDFVGEVPQAPPKKRKTRGMPGYEPAVEA